MGNSDSETINEDNESQHSSDEKFALKRASHVPKRRKDSSENLIKKRYRTELSTVGVSTSPSYDEDSKMPWGSTWQQNVTGALPLQPLSDIGLLQQTSLSAGSLPGVSILGRNPYAETLSQIQASSTAGDAIGGTYSGFAESLLYGLSPAARHFLLRDQIARNQHATMLIAQMGGVQPYDPRSALSERCTTTQLFRQNLPASDMITRYASVLTGSQNPDQSDYWRRISGGVDLADQFRLQHLNQLTQQQQLGLLRQRQQLFMSQQQSSDQLRIEESPRRVEGHQMSGPPLTQSIRGECEETGAARRVPESPPCSFSKESNHIDRDTTDVALQSMPRRIKSIVNDNFELPPCTEGTIPPLHSRRTFPLGIDEDTNWLSEFHCFVREELIEVFQASHEDVKSRNTSITYNQIGLRCRYCAHLTGSARAGRSSAFPSSIRQIYQSFTMMLRDHFPNCKAIVGDAANRYAMLKDKPSQGATDSKRYWIYSALKIGMADSKQGIYMTKETRREGLASLPFGLDANNPWRDDAFASVSLVSPSDRENVTEFLVLLVSQVQPIRLTETECIGNRRSLRVGLPGFGCRYCCQQRRLGLCRMFPARRRTLPTKLFDFYDHIRRCPLCPSSVQVDLASKKCRFDEKPCSDQGVDREFFDRVWTLLGHDTLQGS